MNQHNTAHKTTRRVNLNSKREWVSIEWIKHDDKMRRREKKEKRKTFTGPECVWASDWDQLMLIGNNHYSMGHANRFWWLSFAWLLFFLRERSFSNPLLRKFVHFTEPLLFLITRRKLHQTSINTLCAHTARSQRSIELRVLFGDIRFDMRPTAQHKTPSATFDVQILLWPKVELWLQ